MVYELRKVVTSGGSAIVRTDDSLPSPFPLAAADHAIGDQAIDFAFGVSEFRQHFGGMLAEFRRGATQARFAARKPDRRSNPLVPVLCDHVAAVNGVRTGQGLIDGLHRPR